MKILKKQYLDTSFTAKHIARQKLLQITLSSCKNDVEKYIRQLSACKDEQIALNCEFLEWWIISCLIANLKDRFKNFVQRVALLKFLFKFDSIVAQLREMNRIQKRENEIQTHRAQFRKEAQMKEKKKEKEKKNLKKRSKCFVCKIFHFDVKCWIQHLELRSNKKNDNKKKMNKRKKKKKNKKKKSKSDDKNVKVSHVQTFHVVRFDFNFDFDDFEVTLNSDSNDSHVYFYNIYIDKKAAQKTVAIVTTNSVENNWIVDTRCSHFMILFKIEFVIYETFSASLSVYIANERQMSAIDQSSIILQSDIDDVVINVTIHEILYVSKLAIELFLVNRIIEKRAQIVCINNECRIYAKNEKQILHVVKHRD